MKTNQTNTTNNYPLKTKQTKCGMSIPKSYLESLDELNTVNSWTPEHESEREKDRRMGGGCGRLGVTAWGGEEVILG